MKVLLFVALVLPACLALPIDDARIVGGSNAAYGQFPHQISMQSNGRHFCGGSIISSTVILTAAHCVYGNNQPMTVVAGITNLGEQGVRIPVQRAVYHQNFNMNQLLNDVAVLRLAQPLPLSNTIRPINLRNSAVNPGETLTLSGWGSLSAGGAAPAQLQWIRLRAIDLNTCAQQLAGASPISNGHVCTTSPVNQGACNGDSGGPLIDGYGTQVGIVSWGIPCARGLPDVFTSVGAYLPWINANA